MTKRVIGALLCAIALIMNTAAFAATDDISLLSNPGPGTTLTSQMWKSEFGQIINTLNSKASRTADQTITGNNTFSGTNTVTGTVTLSGTTNFTGRANFGVSADSSSVATGDFWYNTTDNRARIRYNGVSYNLLTEAELAAQSDMETYSSTSKVVTPAKVQHHPGVAKAWAQGSLATGTWNSYGVAYMTKNSTGSMNVFFQTPMSSPNYMVSANHNNAVSGLPWAAVTSRGVAGFTLLLVSGGTPVDPAEVNIVVFGDQ